MSTDLREHWAGAYAIRQRSWLLEQARRICRNETDAEDLVQESLLRFIKHFGQVESFPSERTCEAWLVRTASNLFKDQCRKRRVQAHGAKDPQLSGEAFVPQEPPSPPEYETITDDQFAQALLSLSPKNRTAFELHAAGNKYQDIARSLGIKVGTVAKRLHSARAKLHERLQAYLKSGRH
jgi:RNA polymerase sigma-70 factor (ECF subfamily)